MMRSILVLLALVMSACSTTARLYPVDGPYSKMNPPVVIEAKVSGVRGGEIAFTLPDGSTCKGEWSSNTGTSVGVGFGGGTTGYGMGIGGTSTAGAFATCTDGRRVDFDFSFNSAGVKSGTGMGKDSQGNVYRLMI